jgi:hypothetical protein
MNSAIAALPLSSTVPPRTMDPHAEHGARSAGG